jgi:hypothetical protein
MQRCNDYEIHLPLIRRKLQLLNKVITDYQSAITVHV